MKNYSFIYVDTSIFVMRFYENFYKNTFTIENIYLISNVLSVTKITNYSVVVLHIFF